MSEHDKTPPDGPRAISLSRLVRDTPDKPLTVLDVRLARFNADLDSVPPPVGQLEEFQATRVRQVHQSGSWELEALIAGQGEAIKRLAAQEMAREVEARVEAERELAEIKARERQEAREARKAWAERAWGALMLLVGVGLEILRERIFR